jgi:RNA polymerase sigma-70 factor (ECF subfamily)
VRGSSSRIRRPLRGIARESRSSWREVEAALGRLSEKLRAVVVLRHSAGLSYDEIAETLDLPLGTVKRRLFDAMEKMRRMLEEP